MATTSLAEGLALQGRNTGAEQIGKLQFQMNEADKGRQLKKALMDAQQAKEVEKNFKITGTYNRLIYPEVTKLAREYTMRLSDLKSSGNPTWVNEANNLVKDYETKMVELSSLSKIADDLDTQTKSIDRNKIYFTKNFDQYLNVFKSANSLTELQDKLQKSGIKDDKFLKIHENGLFNYTGGEIVPVEKELESEISKLDKTVSASYNLGLPEGGTKISTVQERPLTIKSAEQAFRANPSAYGGTRPMSIEDVVNDYIDLHPQAVLQLADKNSWDVQTDASGNYTPETRNQLKDYMMKYVSEYANPKTTSVISRPKASFVIGNQQEPTVLTATKNLDIIKPTANVEFASLSAFGLGASGYNTIATARTVTSDGQSAAGASLKDKKIDGVRVMPYYVKRVGNLEIKIPIKKSDKHDKVAGVYPFVLFGAAGKDYFLDIDAFSSTNLINGTLETKTIENETSEQKRRAVQATNKWKEAIASDPSLKNKSADEINSLLFNYYNQ